MTRTSHYSDRVTTFYASGPESDAIIFHKITVEPETRRFESVDFETIALVFDQDDADKIRRALKVLNELDAWTEGDEEERDLCDIMRSLQALAKEI